MIRNYFRIAWRSLLRNRTFSFINIFGLTLGFVCCMLITMFVHDELGYDRYAAVSDRIYRVQLHVTGNGDIATYPTVDVAVGKGMANSFPEVEAYTRFSVTGNVPVRYKEVDFKERRLAYADSNFLNFFSLPLIEGDARTALAAPSSIVITRELARKYFGTEDPLGKSLVIGTRFPYKVTGVMNAMPEQSHFHFDALMSTSTLPYLNGNSWSNISTSTYLRLTPGADPKKLEAKFPELVAKNVVPEIQHDMGVSLAEAQKSVNTFRFFLQPLTSIHLYSDTKYEIEANSDIRYVYIFGALALFILLLACVNFTNLSTAGAFKRAREIGIRKVLGSLKSQLIVQFLAESVLLSFFALALSFLLVYVLLPYFNQLSGKHVLFNAFLTPGFIAISIVSALAAGILAGVYPAFFLSSFNTIRVLKGAAASTGNRKSVLRSGLVVFQFFVSTALIISTIVVYRQLHYMQDKKLGYDTQQLVSIEDTYLLGNNEAAFAQQLLRDSRVSKATVGRDVPGSVFMDGSEVVPRNPDGVSGKEIHSNIYHVDYDYIPTLGMKIIAGRNFSRDFGTDSTAVIINEAAVEDLGWKETGPLGKTIVQSGQQAFTVIGVVADFHYASVKQKIAPLMMRLGRGRGGMIVKIGAGNVKPFLDDVKKQWDAYHPGAPFSYHFLDEQFASLYASEKRTGSIFTTFSIIAIFIACLGLFGLAAFVTEQRTREIGIRKVLGATVEQLLVLVTREFLVLVALAFLIAAPVSWWLMHDWLQSFAYRISPPWWIFGLSGILAFLVALATVSFQAIKVALANPVRNLRTE